MRALIVADSGRARFYELDEDFENLTETFDLVHPEARLRASEVYEGDLGRRSGGSLSPHNERRDVEAEHFARQVAEEARKRVGDYESLHIVAPPRFLGQLRKQLSSHQRSLLLLMAAVRDIFQM